ncbi:MAG: 7-carboxy-7-deazaguanine synthase QueE [Mangrovibacterium sp.]
MNLKVVEIFHSIQGEGANFGMPAVFVRLANCNKNCIFCDTDWSVGADYTLPDLKTEVDAFSCRTIIWTGGEPTLQLTDEVLRFFPEYYHCIETNGSRPVPSLIDYISCSPKVKSEELLQNIPFAHELRFPVAIGDALPLLSSLPQADRYLVSPVFDDAELNQENLEYCVLLVKNNPPWRLSVQIHKLLNVR